MNSKIRIALFGAALAMGSALALAPSTAAAQNQPAPGDTQISGSAPSPAHVWMAGHWNSEGGQWKWVAAHWEQPPSRGAAWINGHWVSQNGSWVWVNGAWNVGEQAQSAPPQPPSGSPQDSNQGYAQNGQGMPMPSSPAPFVDGGYGPGGTARAMDQGDVSTDYAPGDYAVTYPDYYYAGYPWYWGFPGAYLGFGWGGGYWGRGGYYGHGHGYGYGYGHGGYYHGNGYGHGGGVAHGSFGGHVSGGHR